MTVPGRWQRTKDALNILRGKSEQYVETYQKVGFKVAVGQSHLLRVELMSKALPFLNDKMADIADRVDYLDEMITLIGMPWGRGRSDSVWSQAYALWQDFMGYWRWFESQRRWYEPTVMVVVQQLRYKPVIVALEGGGTTTKLEEEWSEDKKIAPETYFSTLHRDEELKEKPSLKLVRTIVEEPLMGGDEGGMHPQFNPKKAEKVVRNFGEREMIICGMIVLNFAWHEMDVTVQSVDVIVQPSQQQEPFAPRMEYPSQTVPESSAQTGVHK